jgi:hypothetical protein
MNTVIVEYEAEITGCTPTLSISTNHNNFTNPKPVKHGTHLFKEVLDLTVVDRLRIKFTDKVHNSKGETWLHMKNISIDGIDLNHVILSGKQWPQYDNNFHRVHSPPDFYQPGTKFFHNGVYELPIQLPIWKWCLNIMQSNA